MGCINDIPDEILVHIFSYLSPYDIKRLSYVNSRFYRVVLTESIWGNFCRSYCFVENKEKETWKETYIEYFQQYGHYLLSETELFHAWKRLMKFIQAEAPAIYDSLEDGLKEHDVEAWEKQQNITLPPSLKFLYQLCGGQTPNIQQPGLFGSLCNMYSRTLNTYYFCGLNYAELQKDGEKESAFQLLPISKDHIGNQYCIVLPTSQDLPKYASAPAAPPSHCIVWKTGNCLFHAADSLLAWLQEYSERILEGQHVIENGHILKYFYHPKSVCQTGSIITKAGWAPYQGHDRYMQFEYRIILQMKDDADPKESCQLQTRHWDITHFDNNRKESVHGPGVVGQHPVMKPGAKFSWMSRTFFAKPGGSMGGHFVMRNFQSMTDCTVECPIYTMIFPKEYTQNECR